MTIADDFLAQAASSVLRTYHGHLRRLGASRSALAFVTPSGTRYSAGASGDAVVISGDTPFPIGSVTKVFTALAILAVIQNEPELGLSLDKPIEDYPEVHNLLWPSGKPSIGSYDGYNQRVKITLRHLLSHTAGLTRDFNELEMAQPILTKLMESALRSGWSPPVGEEFLSMLLDAEFVMSAPEAEYRYSNNSLQLAAAVVEARSGRSIDDLVRRYVVNPLGLCNTKPIDMSDLAPTFKAFTPPGAFPGAEPVPFDEHTIRDRLFSHGARAAAGSLDSTANELAQLFYSLATRNSVLPHAAFGEMTRVQFSRVKGGEDQALCLERFGNECYGHAGFTFGARSHAGFSPERALVSCVISDALQSPEAAQPLNTALMRDLTTIHDLSRKEIPRHDWTEGVVGDIGPDTFYGPWTVFPVGNAVVALNLASPSSSPAVMLPDLEYGSPVLVHQTSTAFGAPGQKVKVAEHELPDGRACWRLTDSSGSMYLLPAAPLRGIHFDEPVLLLPQPETERRATGSGRFPKISGDRDARPHHRARRERPGGRRGLPR